MKKVLVSIDFSDAADQVIEKVSKLVCCPETTVHLMHIVEPSICYEVTGVLPDEVPFPVLDSEERNEVKIAAAKCLHQYAEKLRAISPAKVEEVVADEFEIGDAIISYAQENDIDLIAVGKHGKGFLATVLVGSVASSVVKHSPIPVVVIPITSEK